MKCNTSYRCNRKKSWIGCQIIIGREAKNRLDISDGSNNVRSSMFEFLKAKIGVRTWLLSDEHVQCPFDVWSTVRRIFSEHHIALKYADPSKNSIFLQFWKPCSMKIILLRYLITITKMRFETSVRSSIVLRWTCSCLFDVRKMMFDQSLLDICVVCGLDFFHDTTTEFLSTDQSAKSLRTTSN